MSDIQNPVRRLTITSCKDVYHGKNSKGKEYTIYEVQAVDEHGQPVQQTLKSFDNLEIGLSAEFEVEKYDGGQHGISFTLKQRREKLGPRVQRLEEVVPALERRVEHLERTMGVQPTPPPQSPPPQQPPAQQAPPPQPPPPAPEPTPAQLDDPSTARFGGSDDIPF